MAPLNTQADVIVIAAVLTTLAEIDGTPESNLYMLCGMDLERSNIIRDTLVWSGDITCKSNYLRITDKGRLLANRLNAVMGMQAPKPSKRVGF